MFRPVHSCYTNTERCPQGIKLLNQFASLRGTKVQHALHEVLLGSLPDMLASLERGVKRPSRKKTK